MGLLGSLGSGRVAVRGTVLRSVLARLSPRRALGEGLCRCWSRRHRPSLVGSAQPEHGQPGQVYRAGQQPEVGVDAGGAADPGSSSAVVTANEMAELAFDLGSGAAVVGHT